MRGRTVPRNSADLRRRPDRLAQPLIRQASPDTFSRKGRRARDARLQPLANLQPRGPGRAVDEDGVGHHLTNDFQISDAAMSATPIPSATIRILPRIRTQ